MKTLRISLARINSNGLKKKLINPFWFTTDCSIRLSHKNHNSIKVYPDKLSERTLLELKAACKLGLIKIDLVTN